VDVSITGDRITGLGDAPDGAEVIDGAGMTLLPGLFDCHTHLLFDGVDYMKAMQRPFSYGDFVAVHNLETTLRLGITTVRDAGGADLGLKQALEEGLIRGPRVRIAISILSQTGGHADDWFPSGACVPLVPSHPGRPGGVVDGVENVRKRVREVRRAAVRAGVRSIEHGIYLDDEGIEMMLDRGTFLVPTLSAPQAVLDAVADGVNLPAAVIAKTRAVADIHKENVAKAIRAGVKVAMGTDSGVGPHGRNLKELSLMVDCGMTPIESIKAASLNSAQLLGLDDDLGSIEVGKRADFVLIEGGIAALDDLKTRVRAVFKDGVKVV
jgi:imidazolonepropionase-like amidohydrolase